MNVSRFIPSLLFFTGTLGEKQTTQSVANRLPSVTPQPTQNPLKPIFLCGSEINGYSPLTAASCQDLRNITIESYRESLTLGYCMERAYHICNEGLSSSDTGVPEAGNFNSFAEQANCADVTQEPMLSSEGSWTPDITKFNATDSTLNQIVSFTIPGLDYLSSLPQSPVRLDANCTSGQLRPYLPEQHSFSSNYLFKLNESFVDTDRTIECTGWINAGCTKRPFQYLLNIKAPIPVEEGIVCGSVIKRYEYSTECQGLINNLVSNNDCNSEAFRQCNENPDLYFSTNGEPPVLDVAELKEITTSSEINPDFYPQKFTVPIDTVALQKALFASTSSVQAAHVEFDNMSGQITEIAGTTWYDAGTYQYDSNLSSLSIELSKACSSSSLLRTELDFPVHYIDGKNITSVMSSTVRILISAELNESGSTSGSKPRFSGVEIGLFTGAGALILFCCISSLGRRRGNSTSTQLLHRPESQFDSVEWDQLDVPPPSLPYDWNDEDAKQCAITYASIEEMIQEAGIEKPKLTAILRQPISQTNNPVSILWKRLFQSNRIFTQMYNFDDLKSHLRENPINPWTRQRITPFHLVKLIVPPNKMEEIQFRIANPEVEEDPESDLGSMMRNHFANTARSTHVRNAQVSEEQGIELNPGQNA